MATVRRLDSPKWRLVLVPALLSAYLLLQWFLPSHLHLVWLGVAVLAAARTWGVWGGVIMTLVAGLATAFGLWRIGGLDLLRSPLILSGYGWAGIATLALGVYVGSFTRQARRMAQINADLRQAQQQLGALHQIALSLSTTLDSQRLMEIILEQLGTLWGYDHGSIFLVDEDSGELVLSAAQGYEASPGLRMLPNQGICGAVVQQGEPVCVGDVTSDPRHIGGVPGARSELAVPLTWDGTILGVLTVASPEFNAYTPKDVTLLTTVAEQAASYLANARHHQYTRHLAITDPHTGLFNYRHYLEQVAHLINQAQLTGKNFSLLMLDLDLFKQVNDTYGHPTGDVILEQTARLIRLSCRQADLVFRYGGEEFAVILPETEKHVAAHVAERIRQRMASNTFATKQGRPLEFSLSCSIGVASYPEDGLSHVDLILAADRALYAAKRAGRNQVMLYKQDTSNAG